MSGDLRPEPGFTGRTALLAPPGPPTAELGR
ncbi:hypothetical protein J2X68_006310 [Streptomyces sp. 3330]|nr:hypothetical protein [Streptomyces sp. 3330]